MVSSPEVEVLLGLQSVSEILERAISAMWPSRAQRELLLDLGERKSWTENDARRAIRGVADWSHRELLLPREVRPIIRSAPSRPWTVRALGEQLEVLCPADGVARWIAGLAPALGSTPKTIANSLAGELRCHRSDHRWLALIERIARGEGQVDAWAYHRRSPQVVGAAFARMAGGGPLDAGDALLVTSLLALWQRRRPTHEVRANRGRLRRRRVTPKPVAELQGTLLSGGQLAHIGRLAKLVPPKKAANLLVAAVEATLTVAHLAPHPARSSRDGTVGTGEPWLRAAERTLESHHSILADHTPVIHYRFSRMRAWRDEVTLGEQAGLAVRSAYVRASTAVEARERAAADEPPITAATPGLLMLLPQLRSLGHRIEP